MVSAVVTSTEPPSHRLPRIVIAAPASGHGTTTVATGLMAALRSAGQVVSGHKVGPDYLDPGFHALATGRPGRNLDPQLVGVDRLVPLLLHGAATPEPADVAVIEGVRGLYDGALGREGFASTAHVAGVLGAPVLLVVDISGAARTVAAVVHGLASFDSSVRIAGVILNKAGSARHAGEVTDALEATGVPVLGVLGRDEGMASPAGCLGLLTAQRHDPRAVLDTLAGQITAAVDLDEVLRIARSAPDLVGTAWDPAAELAAAGLTRAAGGPRPVVAVAGGRACTFRYAETDELLRAAGLDPVIFDPATDAALPPATAGLYLGGGLPEVHAAGLSANSALRTALREAVLGGIPTVAEGAGLLYLCETVDGAPMTSALPAAAVMTSTLVQSYRSAILPADSLLGPAGSRATGHESHCSTVSPARSGSPAWLLDGAPAGFSADPAGTGRPTLHASYLHTHWAGSPALAAHFASAVRSATPMPRATDGVLWPVAVLLSDPDAPTRQTEHRGYDLHHHGDADIADGLVDLAVNVRLPTPPDWLADRLRDTVSTLGRYPRPDAAIAAIATRHGRPTAQVLPTAGGAEAFTLLARAFAAIPATRAVVVHPQFTEPEAALRTAGVALQRVILNADNGFALDPRQIPATADLVLLGNPTNPTGVLHAADLLRQLLRPGRTLVVDEAFMDAVPGERESLAEANVPGLVVLRSLTKTWGLAGLRAGYAVGDVDVLSRMRSAQPPWSVSSPALAAIVACLDPVAVAQAERAARTIGADRDVLIDGLADLGLPVAGRPATPFVLVDTSPLGLPDVRECLRDNGFAVRRGDTFPGLGRQWIRIAVRRPAVSRRLLEALARCRVHQQVSR